MKHEARNSKYETISNTETRNSKRIAFFRFGFQKFGFASDFGFRISDFRVHRKPARFVLLPTTDYRLPTAGAGFTLIETIVALALIFSAMAGPVTLASRGIFFAKFSKNKLIAANLAQEGLEIVRKMRDDNLLAVPQRAFDNGLTCGIPPCEWESDVFSLSLNGYTGALLLRDPDSGIYHMPASGPGGTPTLFARKITTSKPGANELLVESEVTWTESGIDRAMRLQETFYNWE